MTDAESKLKAALVRKEAVVRAYAKRIAELEAQVAVLIKKSGGNGGGTPPSVKTSLHTKMETPVLPRGLQMDV